jgi:hypothetical protein
MQYHIIFRVAIWVMILMEILRRPQWTFHYSDWSDGDRFLVSNVKYATTNAIIGVDILALLVLGVGLFFDYMSEVFHCSVTTRHQLDGRSSDPGSYYAPPPPVSHTVSVDRGMQLSEVGSTGPMADDVFSDHHPSGSFKNSHDTSMTGLTGLGLAGDLDEPGIGRKWHLRTDRERQFRRVAIYMVTGLYALKWLEVLFAVMFVSLEMAGHDFAVYVQGEPMLTVFPLECVYAMLIEQRYIPLLKTTFRTIPRFFYLIVLLGVTLLAYAAVARYLVNPNSMPGEKYFGTFANGLWTMFNVMNAASWPDPFVACYQVLVMSERAFH